MRLTEDYATLSTRLRALHNKWWKEMIEKRYRDAAYTSNDIEAVSRRLASFTHQIYEGKTP